MLPKHLMGPSLSARSLSLDMSTLPTIISLKRSFRSFPLGNNKDEAAKRPRIDTAEEIAEPLHDESNDKHQLKQPPMAEPSHDQQAAVPQPATDVAQEMSQSAIVKTNDQAQSEAEQPSAGVKDEFPEASDIKAENDKALEPNTPAPAASGRTARSRLNMTDEQRDKAREKG